MSNGSIPKNKPNRVLIYLGFLGLLLVGCTQIQSEGLQTATLEGKLIPYVTSTPNQASVLGTGAKTSTPIPTILSHPTSTPLVYEIVENDTLIGIANQHSVSLEDLITANPGIDPNFLTIGLTLTIPLDGVVSAALPTSTPISIIIQSPVCYLQVDGSLHCISVVDNDQNYTVENVTVEISLQFENGEESYSQIAITPLNIIQRGQKAAVSASFAPPIPENYIVRARLLSVIPVSSDDQRYLDTDLQIHELAISPHGHSATINGSIEILREPSNSEQPVASTVWVSAFAYDGENNIVGIRKWVADDDLISDNWIDFKFDVYSLGPAIDHVDILTESRP
ncbi:LysM peptidoglycan-binding domain-containing protein [Chloroflexota bacterium]